MDGRECVRIFGIIMERIERGRRKQKDGGKLMAPTREDLFFVETRINLVNGRNRLHQREKPSENQFLAKSQRRNVKKDFILIQQFLFFYFQQMQFLCAHFVRGGGGESERRRQKMLDGFGKRRVERRVERIKRNEMRRKRVSKREGKIGKEIEESKGSNQRRSGRRSIGRSRRGGGGGRRGKRSRIAIIIQGARGRRRGGGRRNALLQRLDQRFERKLFFLLQRVFVRKDGFPVEIGNVGRKKKRRQRRKEQRNSRKVKRQRRKRRRKIFSILNRKFKSDQNFFQL